MKTVTAIAATIVIPAWLLQIYKLTEIQTFSLLSAKRSSS